MARRDGALRELTLVEATLSSSSQHRVERPQGLEGREPGQPLRQRVIRVLRKAIELGAIHGCDVGPGDRLVLETPGGGGWGETWIYVQAAVQRGASAAPVPGSDPMHPPVSG